MNRHLKSLLALVACFVTSIAQAQAPTLGYLYPPAVERGKTANVQLGGFDLTPDTQFLSMTHLPFCKSLEIWENTSSLRPYWEGPAHLHGPHLPLPLRIPATSERQQIIRLGWFVGSWRMPMERPERQHFSLARISNLPNRDFVTCRCPYKRYRLGYLGDCHA